MYGVHAVGWVCMLESRQIDSRQVLACVSDYLSAKGLNTQRSANIRDAVIIIVLYGV